MRRLPKRKGISAGTFFMLTVTALVVVGCGWLFPKLLGETDFHFDATELAVAFDRSYTDLTAGMSGAAVPIATPLTSAFQAQPTTPPETPAPAKPVSFRLTAAGSVAIDSSVQKAMTDDTGYHFDDLFSPLQEEIQGDLAIFTLENTSIATEKLSESNVPTDVLTALRGSGFTAVSLGYPGALNGGVSGLQATQEAVRGAGMTPYGLYTSQEQRDNLTLIQANEVSIALLNYQNDLTSTGKKKTSKEEQAFVLAAPTLPVISADIQTAREAGAQIVIVSLCWGKEGATSPTKTQRELAQAIADAGADIILGTHSGALQTVEVLTANRTGALDSQTLCAYSLGNLFSNEREKRTNISGILLHANVVYDPVTKTTAFEELSYTPTYVWRGKKTDKTVYAIVPSDLTPPDYITGDQLGVMERSLTLVQGVMDNTILPARKPGEIFSGH